MYSLYAIERDRESIIKSVGSEYEFLDTDNLILILIDYMMKYKLLDNDSLNIISNPSFYELLLIDDDEWTTSEYYYANSMYKLDIILLTLNTVSSKYLVQIHGSNKAKSLLHTIIPDELTKNIILEQTDIDTIISISQTNSAYNKLLNDPSFLKQLATNIYNTLLPLENKVPQYKKYIIDSVIGSVITSIITNKNYDVTKNDVFKNLNEFVEWYTTNYYSKYFNGNRIKYYIFLRQQNRDKEAKIVGDDLQIIMEEDGMDEQTYRYITETLDPSSDLRYLFGVPYFYDMKNKIIYDALIYNTSQYKDNTFLVNVFSDLIDDNTEVIDMIKKNDLLRNLTHNVLFFKMIIKKIMKPNEFYNYLITISKNINDSISVYNFASIVNKVLGLSLGRELIRDEWKDVVLSYINSSINNNIDVRDITLTDFFDTLVDSSYVTKKQLKEGIYDIISDFQGNRIYNPATIILKSYLTGKRYKENNYGILVEDTSSDDDLGILNSSDDDDRDILDSSDDDDSDDDSSEYW